MEKVSCDIDFSLKNNPLKELQEISKVLVEIQSSTQEMVSIMSNQMSEMQNPIDKARESWLNLSEGAGGYFAVFSENASGIALLFQGFKELKKTGVMTSIATTAQQGLNQVIKMGKDAFYIYQMQVLTAQAAISTTTGATRALNMVIAASPYLIAATAAAALAIGIYKIATSSNQTTEAQKRLSTTFADMNTEVAKETTALNSLFAPLNNAKVGSEEWQKAKDDIMAKYGNYLSKIGVEITSADSARVAYNKLSQAIINTARARAMDKATSGAGDAYAQAEGDALKNIREQLYSGIGSGAGKITAIQAGKAWAQIREAVRSGKDIPQEAKEILESTNTTYSDRFGVHELSPIANYIYRQVDDVRKAHGVYAKEMADAKAMYGGSKGDLLDNSAPAPVTTPAVIPRVENGYADSSLTALEVRLRELKEKQKNAPIETQLSFTQDIAQLEDMIAGIRMRMEHAQFEARYTLKPISEDSPGDGPIKNAMQSSLGRGGALEGFKIPEMDIEKPLSGMEAWNAALDAASEKNATTIEGLNAMGGAMGTLGNAIGGQAGAWLDWAGGLLDAIAQALPQLAALATANTATAATGAASSVASIPFVGPILAVAAVASVLGTLANLPKFADGGLAYGPTLGLFGEYAGAGNNPEVVAPLNRLRQLIQPTGDSGMGGKIEFVIDGRNLRGVLNKIDNFNRRTV